MNYLNNLMNSILGYPPNEMTPYTQGMQKQGNIDLNNRPSIPNPQGGHSGVFTMTVGIDNGRTVLLPRVVNGKILSEKDAFNHFKNTGEHMGLFHSKEAADAYDKKLHEDMGWLGPKNVWK